MQRVFLWMFAGLSMTAIIAVVLNSTQDVPKMLMESPGLFWGVIIAELAVVFGLSFLINRLSVFAATFGFFLYAALNGITFTLILARFELGTIGAAFFIAAGMFGIFAVFGYVTKIDLSKIGSIALMVLLGLIIASIVNFFFISYEPMNLIISYALVVLISIITAWDIQKIKSYGAEAQTEEQAAKFAIFGALMLYLDFIILFKNILYILNSDD
nr:Bax inhibitor-1/YccA family protein [Polycladospora coralii]